MTAPALSTLIELNATLLEAIVKSAQVGLQMTGVLPTPIGASKIAGTRHDLSILVGLMGESTGSMTLNISKDLALLFTEGLLGEKFEEFNEQVLDAVGEVANMVCGVFKDTLEQTEIGVRAISCPAVVIGPSYEFYYSAGFTTVSVDFEVDEIPKTNMASRLFSVSVSLMKR